MGSSDDGHRRRVLVPQALGADEFLRVTWHEQRGIVVFSQWDGGRCVAAIPVRVDNIAELAELAVAALASTVPQGHPWEAPRADDVVTLDEPIARTA